MTKFYKEEYYFVEMSQDKFAYAFKVFMNNNEKKTRRWILVGLKPWACHATGNEANLLAGCGSCLAQKEGVRVHSEDKEPEPEPESKPEPGSGKELARQTRTSYLHGEWIKTRSKTHSHNILWWDVNTQTHTHSQSIHNTTKEISYSYLALSYTLSMPLCLCLWTCLGHKYTSIHIEKSFFEAYNSFLYTERNVCASSKYYSLNRFFNHCWKILIFIKVEFVNG